MTENVREKKHFICIAHKCKIFDYFFYFFHCLLKSHGLILTLIVLPLKYIIPSQFGMWTAQRMSWVYVNFHYSATCGNTEIAKTCVMNCIPTHFRIKLIRSSTVTCAEYVLPFFLSITSSFFHSLSYPVCVFAGLSLHVRFRLQCHHSLVALAGCCAGVGWPWVCPLTDQSLILADGGLPGSALGLGARDHISGAAGRPPWREEAQKYMLRWELWEVDWNDTQTRHY